MSSTFDSSTVAPSASDSLQLDSLFHEWNGKLVAIADRHLSPAIKQRVDPADVVQSAFRTVWRRKQSGTLTLTGLQRAWRLLLRVTRIKAIRAARFNSAGCRNPDKETFARLSQLVRHQHSPVLDHVAYADHFEQLCIGMPVTIRKVLEMRLQGHSVAHIANELNVARQTVYRALQYVRDRYEKLDT